LFSWSVVVSRAVDVAAIVITHMALPFANRHTRKPSTGLAGSTSETAYEANALTRRWDFCSAFAICQQIPALGHLAQTSLHDAKLASLRFTSVEPCNRTRLLANIRACMSVQGLYIMLNISADLVAFRCLLGNFGVVE
jgi:hypothetical protein